MLDVVQPEAKGSQLEQAVPDVADDPHVVLHGTRVVGAWPGDRTVAWPLVDDAGVVSGDVRERAGNGRSLGGRAQRGPDPGREGGQVVGPGPAALGERR